jgi:3'-5' exoribonuclease
MSSKPALPAITRLSDLKSGERGTFFAQLAERTRGATRDNKPFYTCRFRDARRTVTYMVWLDGPYFQTCDGEWQAGQFFKVRALYGEHDRYGPQIDVEQIRPVQDRDAAEGFNLADFGERSRFDPDEMFLELARFVESTIADEPLRRLTMGVLNRHGDRLKRLPASEKRFYPFAGGWVEHTLSVARTAVWLADFYRQRYPDLRPPVNRDLVAAGAVLHDIGRAAELAPGPGPLDPPEPTVDGRLFGHLFLGRDMVRDAAREQGDLNPELVKLLEHMVAAHLALPEWGSPRLPLIPEVLILHHADDLDAKMEMYARCLTRDPGPGPFTERDPALGKQLLKGRSV